MLQCSSRHWLHQPFSSRRRTVYLSCQQNPQSESGCEAVQVSQLAIQLSIASKNLLGPSIVGPVESCDRVHHHQRRSLSKNILQILDDSNLVFEILRSKQYNFLSLLRPPNQAFKPMSRERLVSIYIEDSEILPGHFQSTLHRKYGFACRCFAIQEAYLPKRKTASQQHIKPPNPCAEKFQS